MSQPSSSERNLVCISPINWDEVWEGPQEICSRFAAAGWRVLFVENFGTRLPRLNWQDARRIGARMRKLLKLSKAAVEVKRGVTVYTPWSLPMHPRLQRVGAHWLARQIKNQMNKLGMKGPVVWTYNPSSLAQNAIRAVRPSFLVYCCIHDYSRLSPQHRYLAKDEETLLDEADLVFVLSRQLLEEKRRGRPNVHALPQGANLQDYLDDDQPRSTELDFLAHPIIGYVGTIHEWLDQQLLHSVAEARPDWSFVLIGPERVSTKRLSELPNVIFLGPMEHAALPAYVRQFDVGVVPYVDSAFSRTIRPNKVLEYMVMGKPVVTTFLPELEDLRDHITCAASPQQFIQAIQLGLDSHSSHQQSTRRKVALSHSMDHTFSRLEELVLSQLAKSEGRSVQATAG